MSGPLNLMKLCVGCDTPAALDQWQRHHWQGGPARHVTRMWPKRQDELLAGGGVYAELYTLQAEQFTAQVPVPAPSQAG